ncbi:transcriptional regulator, TetR family [Beutenbergia cavernae DSM 12333]|uniref:Transcriptional regulator, TetR family n=1 Tax=Beutenbergia cavernae (strain ATCC BAA-8 / DSM 12333 / CCUG 43141 / JCM 11478 / NBRC 16432 / NCIMB 13614 / HKI 0122) TaxID=471853 RepID=C5C6H2_BEUC1|nr:TetR family transcriptional regulator [Beutenbergia cavernae]ACQ80378.1 transcriptional regulator, TetR family [Beutenbergia cavernae DSM 12333]
MPDPHPAGRPRPRPRRHDPRRRDRIVDACLDVVAADGVAGTSHRKVAAAADVPLGSMTYHFAGMTELLHAAFTRFADDVAERFERRLAPATTTAEVATAVVALITQDTFATRRDLVLTHELYTLAAREPEFRAITAAWMARSRRALEQHVDPTTARLLDALVEGLTIHRALDTGERDEAAVVVGIQRIMAEPTTATPHATPESR